MIAFTERVDTRDKALKLGRAVAAERGVERAVAAIGGFCGRSGA